MPKADKKMDELTSFLKVKRNLINILTLGIMILGLPIGIKLAREQQIFTSRARNADVSFLTKEVSGQPESCVVNRNGTLITTCDTISVRIVAPDVLTAKGPELVKTAYAQESSCSCAQFAESCTPGGAYFTSGCDRCGAWCQVDSTSSYYQCGASGGAGSGCTGISSNYYKVTKYSYNCTFQCTFEAFHCEDQGRVAGQCGVPSSPAAPAAPVAPAAPAAGGNVCYVCDGGKLRTNWNQNDPDCNGVPACNPPAYTGPVCKGADGLNDKFCNGSGGGGATTPPATTPPATTPPSAGVMHFKIAENFTALEQATPQLYTEGVSGGDITLFTFTDKTPGQKFVFIQFIDDQGNKQTLPGKSITLISQPPVITSLDAPFDISNNQIKLKITGDNFGSSVGRVKVNGVDLASNKIDNWNDNFGGKQRVLAHIDNVSSSQNLSVVLVRSDGEQSAPATYRVGVTQLSLGAKLFGRAQRDFDQENVDLSIFEMVGVGTTSSTSQVVSSAREKVVIDEEGTINNIRTRLKEGANYIACVLAPLSVRRCTDQFTAVPGNNIIPGFQLPMGDVNADGCINGNDAKICKSEWGIISSNSNKRCNFNRDNRVNSYEWSILLWSYNKCKDDEPK